MTYKDPMGDRLKVYEAVETDRRANPILPLCVRLDGRAFHTFTAKLQRPYDYTMSFCMIETAKYLVEQTHARIAYTQSDEITIIIEAGEDGQLLFGGKFHKLTSVIAGMCSARFARLAVEKLPETTHRYPCFDARAFNVPSRDEAANVVLWRWFDARKNSISALAQSVFTHSELQGKDTKQMREMLLEKHYDWDTYPAWFRHGTFLQRRPKETMMDGNKVIRHNVESIDMPPFNVVKNRVGVIFAGEEPAT